MLFNTLARTIVVLSCILILMGCKPEANQSVPEAEQVKTAAEYKAEADKQITEQNMNQELASLEQAVDTEATETP